MATAFNGGSGNWTSASTWRGSRAPAAADNVVLDFYDPAHPVARYHVDLSAAATVGDLSLVDSNTLSLSASASLSVNGLLIGRDSGLTTSASVQAAGALHNNGLIQATLSANLTVSGSALVNTGALLLSQFATLHSGFTETFNSGLIRTTGSAHVNIRNTINTGVIASQDDGNVFINGAVLNSGTIEAIHGTISLLGQIANPNGGQLIVSDGGTLVVAGQVIDGLGIISGKGTMMFAGPSLQSTTSIVFQGPGTFILGASKTYSGTIADFGAGDRIDMADVGYVPGANSYDPQSGILTVGHGDQTASVHLLGSYAANDFAFRSDGQGGTLVSFSLLGDSAASTVGASDLQLASLYIGYFGRAADPQGLAYWHDQLTAGQGNPAALATIAASFSTQAEAASLRPFLADPQHATQANVESFIEALYANLFGRAPDAEGANYWRHQLAANLGKAEAAGHLVLDMVNGAQAQDAATLENRSEAAAFFSDRLSELHLSYDEAADALARAKIGHVTSDVATLAEAKAAMAAYVDGQVLLPLTGLADLLQPPTM